MELISQKIIQSYVKTPILHCNFGPMPDKLLQLDTRYLYIARKMHSPIEIFDFYEDAIAELPQKFMFGTIDGNLIDTMKTVIQDVINRTQISYYSVAKQFSFIDLSESY